jgi:hypothetical protein
MKLQSAFSTQHSANTHENFPAELNGLISARESVLTCGYGLLYGLNSNDSRVSGGVL